MKIKILDPNGVHFSGKVLPADSTHEIDKGPHTDIWLRFGQAEVVKGKKADSEPADEGGGKKADAKKEDKK